MNAPLTRTDPVPSSLRMAGGPAGTPTWSATRLLAPVRICAVIASLLVGVRPAGAQRLEGVRVLDANGQIDFWLPARRRPDTDHTNGASVEMVFDGAIVWGGLVPSRPTPCSVVQSEADHCVTTELRVGQDIYTPPWSTRQSAPQPGARPYAGWLYVAGTARTSTTAQSDALTLELGATGSPSLAEKVQTTWHSLIGYPRPLGWAHQIPFEPGLLLAYERQQEILRASIANVPVLSIVPHGRVSVGNVLTGASAGLSGRMGYGVTTPWSTGARAARQPIELFVESGVREDFVAYDLFLDRGTTRPARHVQKRPWVTQYEFGGGVRWRNAELEYRGITRGQDYTTGRRTQPLGLLVLGLRW